MVSAPVAAVFFRRVTLLGIISNVLVVPWTGWFILPAGFLSVALCLFYPSIAVLPLWVANWCSEILISVVKIFARMPGISVTVKRPVGWEICVYYLLVLLVLFFRPKRGKMILLSLYLVVVSLAVISRSIPYPQEHELKITFISVGQGESILVEFPDRYRMLVDGGGARKGHWDAGRNIIAPFLQSKGLSRLDAIMVSHPQTDHYGGLEYIASHFGPKWLWIPPFNGCEEQGYRYFLEMCRSKGIRIRVSCNNMGAIRFHGTEFEFLNPPCAGRRVSNGNERDCSKGLNNESIVLRICFHKIQILLTGDIERDAEKMLAGQTRDLKAFILKVPHHGSSSSSSPAFLDAVSPIIAVVSAGYGNRFGFPSAEVMARYKRRGIRVYRTDLDGAVFIRTDGHRITVHSFRGRGEIFNWWPSATGHDPSD